MSTRLLHPKAPDANAAIHRIAPQSAGWWSPGLEVLGLQPAQVPAWPSGTKEVCLAPVSVRASAGAGAEDFGMIGERTSPFNGLPWPVRGPAQESWERHAGTGCERAVRVSPAKGTLPARLRRTASICITSTSRRARCASRVSPCRRIMHFRPGRF